MTKFIDGMSVPLLKAVEVFEIGSQTPFAVYTFDYTKIASSITLNRIQYDSCWDVAAGKSC